MIRLSVSARLALLTVGLALLTNILLALFVWQQVRADALGAARRDTIEQSRSLAATWRAGGDAALDAAVDAAASTDDSLFSGILGADGRLARGDGPGSLRVSLTATPFDVAILADGSRTSYALVPIGGRWLLTGRLLDDWRREQDDIVRALALAAVLSALLGVVAGWVVTRYVGGRLDSIADTIEGVIGGNLERRVASTARRDAFDRLASRLNAMLDRLQRLVDELRLVTDSMAHDLRSPLARLRQKVELAVVEADPARREEALASLTGETDVLMRMVGTLLEISRSEAISRDRFTLVDASALVAEVAELYAPVVEDAGSTLDHQAPGRFAEASLHRELMTQALANLVDNALRHAGGTAIMMSLEANADVLRFIVADGGGGIAAGDRDRALSRFGRLDSARTTPGAGLGLALVVAVARLHAGWVELADNHPGLVATIVVPK